MREGNFRVWDFAKDELRYYKFENIMLSTGRKDINGNEIFEEDFIEGVRLDNNEICKGRVYWNNASSRYEVVGESIKYWGRNHLPLCVLENIKIINNQEG